jgi:hypothetical protein
MTTPQGVSDFVPATVSVPSDVPLAYETGQSIGAGSDIVLGSYTITMPAYLVYVNASISDSATVPFITARMVWIDPVNGIDVDVQSWTLPAGSVSAVTAGRGPTRAGSLQLILSNNDPTYDISCSVAIYQSSRAVTRDDWRQPNSPAVPGYVVPASDPPALALGWFAQSIPATTTDTYLLPLWSGQATVQLINDAAAAIQAWLIPVLPPDPSWTDTAIWQFNGTAETETQQVALPRAPCTMSIRNTTAAAVTVGWAVTGQEFSS